VSHLAFSFPLSCFQRYFPVSFSCLLFAPNILLIYPNTVVLLLPFPYIISVFSFHVFITDNAYLPFYFLMLFVSVIYLFYTCYLFLIFLLFSFNINIYLPLTHLLPSCLFLSRPSRPGYPPKDTLTGQNIFLE
jgi:hypothetical protein